MYSINVSVLCKDLPNQHKIFADVATMKYLYADILKCKFFVTIANISCQFMDSSFFHKSNKKCTHHRMKNYFYYLSYKIISCWLKFPQTEHDKCLRCGEIWFNKNLFIMCTVTPFPTLHNAVTLNSYSYSIRIYRIVIIRARVYIPSPFITLSDTLLLSNYTYVCKHTDIYFKNIRYCILI